MQINKKLILLILIFLLCGCSAINPNLSQEETQRFTAEAQNAKLIILDVYHDRCESCKHIEPVIENLKANYSKSPGIVFLKYDLSNPLTVLKSRKIAKIFGLEDIYKSQRFSGVVLIIDGKNRQVTDTLIADYNFDDYTKIIDEKLHAQHPI